MVAWFLGCMVAWLHGCMVAFFLLCWSTFQVACSTCDEMTWQMVGKKDGWKDGTKTDNGICIQTMPTRNYFTFSMERKSDTQDFISAFSIND